MSIVARDIGKPFFVRPITSATITTGNEKTNRPAAHLLIHRHVSMVWESDGNTDLWVRLDLGSAQEIDFVALLNTNAIAATDIRVRIGDDQTEVDGTADYDSTAIDLISPSVTRENGLYHSHLELDSVYTKRWIRIDISSHTGDFRAAHLVIGKKIEPTYFYEPGAEFGIRDPRNTEINAYGVSSGSDPDDGAPIQRTLRMRWPWMTEAEYEASFRPLVEGSARRIPFYLCFDPEANAYRQNRTFFGTFSEDSVAKISRVPSLLEYPVAMISQI